MSSPKRRDPPDEAEHLLAPSSHAQRDPSARRLIADLLRGIGLPYPRDLAVFLQSVGRGPIWHVPVLTYHRIGEPPGRSNEDRFFVTPRVFEEQMAHLAAQGYETVFAGELAEVVKSGGELPPKPVVLTFDDGFACVRERGAPTLAALGLKATVFLITERHHKHQPGYLTRDDIRNLGESGLFEFGSHTRRHRPLTSFDPGERRAEVEGSKRYIEDLTGRECAVFCYPFGDLDERAVESVRGAGYCGAFCSSQGVLHTSGTRWTLARVSGLTQPLERFAEKLRGWRERTLLVFLSRALASRVRGAGIAA
jgi:peptidoglycan/xylan/chitin deacetylase (PgdA/CDA1 family)